MPPRVQGPTSLEDAREVDPTVLGEITSTAIPADPPAVALSVSTYSKMVGPVAHLFAIDSAGSVYDLMVSAGGVVGLADIAYVSTAGNDGTAVVGDMALPFLTIQAALNAVPAGGAVVIGPGTYSEALVMPATNNISILGSGRSVTIITNAVAPTISWTPIAVGVTRFNIYNLSVLNTGGFDVVNLNAVAVNDFLSARAYAFGCEFVQTGVGNVLLATRTNDFTFETCRFEGGALILREPSAFVFNSCPILGGLDARYDDVNPTPINGRQNVSITNGSYVGSPNAAVPANITLRGSPLFVCDRDSGSFGNLIGVGLTFFVAGPIHAPIIIYTGFLGSAFIAGTGAITLPLPAIPAAPFAPAMIVDFSGFVIAGTGLVAFTIAGAIAFTITARQSRWGKTAVGSVSIGALLSLDAKNSSFSAQVAFTVVGSGTMDRSRWLVLGTANPGGGFGILFLPYPSAVYQASVSPFGGVPIAWGIVAKLPGSVQVVTAAAGGVVDLEIIRSP